MADRKVDIDTTKGSASNTITQEEKEFKRLENRARLAEILDRGVVGNRLKIELKDETMHYEWPHKDDISRMQSLGFRVASREDVTDTNASLHDAGDGKIRIGDTVLMICDREIKEDVDAVKRGRYNAAHAPKGGKQKEEKQFETSADIITLPTSHSRVNTAKATDIAAALDAANRDKKG